MLKSAVELSLPSIFESFSTYDMSFRFETKLKLSKMQKVTNNKTRNPIRHTLDEFITCTTSVRIQQMLKN